MITHEDLASVFGKFEMEVAAAKILNMVVEADSWGIEIDAADFRGDDYEFYGFVFLATYGWLEDGMTGVSLVLSKEFAEKVVERTNLKLPDLSGFDDEGP